MIDRWEIRNRAGTALFLLITLVNVAWLHSHVVASIPVQQRRQPMPPGVFALNAALMVEGVAVNTVYFK